MVKQSFLIILCLISLMLGVSPAYALTKPEVRGEAAILIDVQSGQTLYAKNPDQVLPPASTTKIMTALLAIEKGKLTDPVIASPTMLNSKLVYGTQIYLEPGEVMSLDNLLYALLLNSANDAAVAIAEYIGGEVDTFVQLMNQKAKEIGAKHTTFKNPSGLNQEGHLTTARDLALITRTALKNPDFVRYVKSKSKVIPRSAENVPVEMINENKLLGRDPSVDGVKTGYTTQAENCLVASATRNGRQLIGVILKSPGGEIYNDMQNLLDYGFNEYDNSVYKPSGTAISSMLVGKVTVDLILGSPIIVTTKKGEPASVLRLNVIPLSFQVQEVEQGQILANLEVWQGQQLLQKIPLMAARKVSLPKSAGMLKYLFVLIFIGVFILGLWTIVRLSKHYQYPKR